MASPTSSSGADVPPVLPSIPLAPEPVRRRASSRSAAWSREVTTQLSTLVRAEVELAKAEVTAEVQKGVQGSVFFVVAADDLLFSLFFLFFALAELLALWLLRWAAFAIVFGLMVLGRRRCSGCSATGGSARSASRSGRSRASASRPRCCSTAARPDGPRRAGRRRARRALTGPGAVLWRRRAGRAAARTRRRSGCPVRGRTATSPPTASACTSPSAGARGPLVVLLHGFPEFWWAWRHQLPALAEARVPRGRRRPARLRRLGQAPARLRPVDARRRRRRADPGARRAAARTSSGTAGAA